MSHALPRVFWSLPPATRQAIIDTAVREQAAAERRRQEFARYVSAVARETVNGILDDIKSQYPTVYGRRPASAPQPKPAARDTGRLAPIDPKLWRSI